MAVAPDDSICIITTFRSSKDADPSPETFTIRAPAAYDRQVALWKLRGDYGPADVTLSSSQVVEHSPTGTSVGQLVVSQAHPGEASNFELIDSAGGRFKLVGTRIQVDDGTLLDHDQADSHQITVRVRDSLGIALEKTLTISVIPEDYQAPEVTGLVVRSSRWTDAFLDELDAQGLGHPEIARLGYAVPAGPDQARPLPWTELDTVSLVFDEPVVVAQGDLRLAGVRTAEYGLAGSTFHYDPVAHTATWTLAAPLAADKLLVCLCGVEDMAGNPLDGEWAGGAGTLSAGGGTPAGVFLQRLDVLPGDVTGDGMVISNDAVWVGNALGTAPSAGSYAPLLDLSGDGLVISNDLVRVFNNLGSALPDGEPQAPDLPAEDRVEMAPSVLPGTLGKLPRLAERVGPVSGPRVAHSRLLPGASETLGRSSPIRISPSGSRVSTDAVDRAVLAWEAAQEPLARLSVRDTVGPLARRSDRACWKERRQAAEDRLDAIRSEISTQVAERLPAKPSGPFEAVSATDEADAATGGTAPPRDWDHALLIVAAEIDGQAISGPFDWQAGVRMLRSAATPNRTNVQSSLQMKQPTARPPRTPAESPFSGRTLAYRSPHAGLGSGVPGG